MVVIDIPRRYLIRFRTTIAKVRIFNRFMVWERQGGRMGLQESTTVVARFQGKNYVEADRLQVVIDLV
jgi:hypothetical protein